jgi:hypothetical protein
MTPERPPYHLLHHLDRTRRSSHDAGAQRIELELAERGMIELRDEHRRDAID